MLIRLVGCKRYSYKGELFEQGFDYDLDEVKSSYLLRQKDELGRNYFVGIDKPRRANEELIIEEETDPQTQTVKIKRKRGRPRKNPAVRTAGDTSPLDDSGKAPPKVAGEDDFDGDEVTV